MADGKIEIELKDIPQAVMDTVREHLGFFFAPLSVLEPSKKHLIPIGSGTYVEVSGQPAILAATHVWERLQRSELLSVGLSDKAHAFFIPTDKIAANAIPRANDEWGPDLALLRLPLPHAAEISASRSYLNLDLQSQIRDGEGDPAEHDLLMVFGNVAEQAKLELDDQNKISMLRMGCQALFSVREERHERDGYDYIDLGADRRLNGVPQDFGGVSGGGLWRLTLSKSKTGQIDWDGHRRLVGVAYLQVIQSEERALVRCHGPQSLYGIALPKWSA
jgi:hypothetical protein